MCKDQYRYRLDVGTEIIEVIPFFGNSFTSQKEEEKGQRFKRGKLSGKLKFRRGTFDKIIEAGFGFRFTFYIDELDENGIYQENPDDIYTFSYTDCKINFDEEEVEVQPEPFDRYKKIMEGMNKEYDLLKLTPEMVTVKMDVQPLIQVYILGSDVVTNILEGVHWEETILNKPSLGATPISANDLLTEYFFHFVGTKNIIPGVGGGLSPDVSGEYDEEFTRLDDRYQLVSVGHVVGGGKLTDDPDGVAEDMFVVITPTLDNFDDFYSQWTVGGATFQFIGGYNFNSEDRYFFRKLSGGSPPSVGILTHSVGAVNTSPITYVSHSIFQAIRWGILDNDAPIVVQHPYVYMMPWIEDFSVTAFPFFPQEAMESFSSSSKVHISQRVIYARYLTNALTVGVTPTSLLPDVDIVAKNSKYLRAMPLDFDGYIMTDENSVSPDFWGRFNPDVPNFANNYFVRPGTPVGGEGEPIPVAQSEWLDSSLWFYYTPALKTTQQDGRIVIKLKKCIKLFEVVRVLLGEIDDTIMWEEIEIYSRFFFGNSNTIRGSKKDPVFALKGNVISGEFGRVDERAMIRLSDIFKFCADLHQVYWYLDVDNRLVMEHDEYFRNGLNYGAEVVGADLTELIEPKTELNLDFNQNEISYEKFDMPERITHRWMDENVSEPFRGFPIEIISDFVEKGNLDERIFGLFTSDIDFINGSPGSVSSDGFVFFETEFNSGTEEYDLPYVDIVLANGKEYRLQNGYAALVWAHIQYWRYGLPGPDVKINESVNTALSVRRNKIQNLELADGVLVDHMKLVTTRIGKPVVDSNGNVRRIEINYVTGKIKIKIAHDTE